jgi:hypothetical protein
MGASPKRHLWGKLFLVASSQCLLPVKSQALLLPLITEAILVARRGGGLREGEHASAELTLLRCDRY